MIYLDTSLLCKNFAFQVCEQKRSKSETLMADQQGQGLARKLGRPHVPSCKNKEHLDKYVHAFDVDSLNKYIVIHVCMHVYDCICVYMFKRENYVF